MKKRALWRGLTTLFTFIFSLTIIIGVVAESYKATIDTALGTLSEKFVSENTEDDPLYDKFQPSAEVLNEDGTGNSHALIQKAIDLNRQQAAEGAVLLKNNNADGQGLPLAGNSQVTLFVLTYRCWVPASASRHRVLISVWSRRLLRIRLILRIP